MKVRIVDYIGNPGGGVRFAVELIRAFAESVPAIQLELVSSGPALAVYRRFLGSSIDGYADIPPGHWWRRWRYDVPVEALDDCDSAWFPWVHRHRLPEASTGHVVGSFHDAIMFEQPSVRAVYRRVIPDERVTIEGWLRSSARIVVTSHATVQSMQRVFGARADRFDVVAASGVHAIEDAPKDDPRWLWASEPFLLCPANISPHKNHETLLRGVARWGRRIPLVLTGGEADLLLSRAGRPKRIAVAMLAAAGMRPPHRSTYLRKLADELGFDRGRTLHPLGYLSDEAYYGLLRRAWAVVMPTLAEGGGSFPVEEAIWCGIPVICADVPVMREHMERLGAEILWFEPHEPDDLAARLEELRQNYSAIRERAEAQVKSLRRRSWSDVAADYVQLFASADKQKRTMTKSGAI